MQTFGERLERSLSAKGVSQADVARAAGIKDSSMSEWFADKVRPDYVKARPLLRAAAFLDVSPTWLLFGTGERSPSAPAVLTVQEPASTYRVWPFEHVTPERFFALPEQTRIAIASYVDGVVLGSSTRGD